MRSGSWPQLGNSGGEGMLNEYEERVVVTVTLNPAVDVFYHVPHLQPGLLHRVDSVKEDAGGKGINVSKALGAFKIPTIATGFLGGHRGQWISEQLVAAHIDSQFIRVNAETRMNVKVVDGAGRLTELNSQAAVSGQANDWLALEQKLQELSRPKRWIAFCGSLPDGCDPHFYERAIANGKELGAQTILDTSGEALRLGIKSSPNIVKPNRKELGQLVGSELKTLREVVAAAQEVRSSGVSTVVISLGEEGLMAVTQNGVFLVSVPKVAVVSAVGAGDTAVAGLLYGACHGLSIEETLKFAAASGTAAVKKAGVLQPELVDVEAVLPEVRIRKWMNEEAE